MSIGSTINVSVPTVGTTVHTLDQTKLGQYHKSLTVSSEIADVVLNLRPSQLGSNNKGLGLSYSYNPSINDSPNDAASGRVAVQINCTARVGAVLTRAEILNHIRYALSAALKTSLLEDLYDGSIV